MKKAIKLHREAMDLADQAEVAQRRKAHDEAAQLFRKAFESERAAAVLFVNDFDAEPTRSVLLRSAASLALDCQEYREAGGGFLRFSCVEPNDRLQKAVDFIPVALSRTDRIAVYLETHPQFRLTTPYAVE